MTQDDIVSMAMLARIKVRGYYDEAGSTPQELERFAEVVAEATREHSAKALSEEGWLMAATLVRVKK